MDDQIERSTELAIPPYHYPSSWLIGATTHAIDRWVPDVERIFQPAGVHPGGTITIQVSATPLCIKPKRSSSRRKRIWKKIRRLQALDLGKRILFDTREDDFFNWSHQVNFFLSIALAARSFCGTEITIIVPSQMPPVTHKLYRQFGFDVVATDADVTGIHCRWAVSDRQAVASGRPSLIRSFMQAHDTAGTFKRFDLPAKVFLGRRGSRSLANESVIESMLSARGFVKLYAEDLSVPEQFAVFRQATDIVAIHGAGLAPLEYRSLSREPFRLLELAPVGIMTRWFGIMCDQVGGKYIAVRGRIKPQHVAGLYADRPFLGHENEPFEVDPMSLEVAFDML